MSSLGKLSALLRDVPPPPPPPPPPPMSCGIYFLFDGDEIVYIGQSASIELRVPAHNKYLTHDYEEHRRRFDRSAWIPVPSHDLDRYETTLIWKLAPRYNIHAPKAMFDQALADELGLPACDPTRMKAFLARRAKTYSGENRNFVRSNKKVKKRVRPPRISQRERARRLWLAVDAMLAQRGVQ